MPPMRLQEPRMDQVDQPLTSLQSSRLNAVSCGTSTTCVAIGVLRMAAVRHPMSTVDLSTWTPASTIPRGTQPISRLSQRDDLYRGGHKPQLHSLRSRHLRQRINLVTADTSVQCRRSRRHLVLRTGGLHRGWQYRQLDSGLDHHGDHDRWPLVVSGAAASRNEQSELRLLPEHCGVLRGRRRHGPRVRECWLCLATRHASHRGQRTELDFLPEYDGLHCCRIRCISEPDHHHHLRRRADVDD